MKMKIPLEEYIVGVLAGEMPINFDLEALKAVLEEVFNPVESDKPSNAIKLEAKMDEIKLLKKLIFQDNWVAVGNVTCAYGKSLHEDEFQKTISKFF